MQTMEVPIAKLTAKFVRLPPILRLSLGNEGMCEKGKPLFLDLCIDTTDTRFFSHYCEGRCLPCFEAYMLRLRSIN
jgi:hypothetical protein